MSTKTVDVFIWAAAALLAVAVVAFFIGADTLAPKLAFCAFLIASAVIDRLDKIIAELAQARKVDPV